MGEMTTPNEQPDRWMNYREAAEFSGLGRTTLWTLVSPAKMSQKHPRSVLRGEV